MKPSFNKKDILQGTPEWHEWRSQGVGASDVAVLTGECPYKTPRKLWLEKCNFTQQDFINDRMQHGIDCEPKARKWVNKKFNLNLEPMCVESTWVNKYIASLDGYDPNEKVLVEIKSPTTDTALDKIIGENYVHLYWRTQVQWQMMIMQPKHAYIAFWDYRNEECIMKEIEPDYPKQKILRKKAEEFIWYLQNGEAPPLQEKEYLQVFDDEIEKKLELYKQICDLQRHYKEEKNLIKKEMQEHAQGRNFRCGNFIVYKTNSKKTVDTKKMRLDGVDLSSYERESSSCWVIREVKS